MRHPHPVVSLLIAVAAGACQPSPTAAPTEASSVTAVGAVDDEVWVVLSGEDAGWKLKP